MKPNVPWSIKGIDPDARAVAKKAAREAGMTLGEWLNSQIMKSGDEQPEPVQEKVPEISSDQLRQVVDSLNRMNDRLQRTEQDSLKAFTAVNSGLSQIMQRVRNVESDKNSGISNSINDRLSAIENDDSTRRYLEGFSALESALKEMVDELESTRDETLSRVSATEKAIVKLDSRIGKADRKNAEAFSLMATHLQKLNDQLQTTEEESIVLMEEAREAAQSEDVDFIESTSNKLRALANEIKRSGDQIQALEGQIDRLNTKIEDAEERSSQSINTLAGEIDTLRGGSPTSTSTSQEEVSDLDQATDTAQERISRLNKSFEDLASRVESDDEETIEIALEEENDDDENILQQAMEQAEAKIKAASTEDDFEDDDEIVLELADEDAIEAAEEEARLDQEQVSELLYDSAEEEDAAEVVLEEEAPAPEKVEEVEKQEAPAQSDAKKSKLAPLLALTKNKKALMIGGGAVALLVVAGVAGMFLLGGKKDQAEPVTDQIGAVGDGTITQLTEPEISPSEQFKRYKELAAVAVSTEDQNRALLVLKRSANRGYAPAQYTLAEAHRTGTFTEQSPVAARALFQSAAESGNVEAMHKLGSMLAIGEGGEANETLAISWFEQAAVYGYTDSIYNLALIYDPSVDLIDTAEHTKNAEKAYYWYMLAAKLNDPDGEVDAMRVGVLLEPDVRGILDKQVEAWRPARPLKEAN